MNNKISRKLQKTGRVELMDLSLDLWLERCTKKTTTPINWLYRIRLCEACAAKEIISLDQCCGKHSNIGRLISLSFSPAGKRTFCYKKEALAVQKHYLSLDTYARGKYVSERRAHLEALDELTDIAQSWHAAYITELESGASEASETQPAIMMELNELEYEEDDSWTKAPVPFDERQYVKQTPLTETVWCNIKRDFTTSLDAAKARKIALEREDLLAARAELCAPILRDYSNHADRLPCDEALPNLQDFVLLEPLNHVIQQPSYVNLDKDSFMSLIPHLPGMMSQWRQKSTEKSLSIFPGASRLGGPLAVHVARCSSCPAILFYPQVLAHHCMTKSQQSTSSKPWDCSVLLFDERLVAIVKDVVLVLGRDVETTTASELDELEMYIHCQDCDTSRYRHGQYPLFGWRRLISHVYQAKTTKCASRTNLRPVSSQWTKSSECFIVGGHRDDYIWCCWHCRGTENQSQLMYHSAIKAHLVKEHGIKKSLVNVDYYKDLGAPPGISGFTLTVCGDGD
ncbi:uncharacterized protein ARMOST_19511 [Armillaria ostoyae]|uniref:Uncharacterized protein n=1 Tax=Armillaria ostoyae TaxID=47428 RepID=A0A284S4S4_ARMOS|nr:uncharacterized protein ARMOST_19511 [Armillaria ostoyae]